MKNYFYIKEVDSTNVLLKKKLQAEKLPEFFTLRTSFQSSGKGQQGNFWESEKYKNLLVSFLLKPHHIAITEQFVISQIVSLAIINTLKKYDVDAKIKWPNDIYVGNKKLAGILIENSLRSSRIENCIVGIGININQAEFKSNAPNPVSLFQITKKRFPVLKFLKLLRAEIIDLYTQSDYTEIVQQYKKCLFRSTGLHAYKANDAVFTASFYDVKNDGELHLLTENKELKTFYFKEVEFLL